MMSKEDFIAYNPIRIDATESLYKSEIYYKWLDTRRSVREFSSKPVSKEVIKNVIKSGISSGVI